MKHFIQVQEDRLWKNGWIARPSGAYCTVNVKGEWEMTKLQ
jgi:hypothetical protein